MRESECLTFTVPLDSSTHCQAQKFYKQQGSPQKAKQVYLNTLAVSAVDFYLRHTGFETDLEASDSFDPEWQTIIDTADLEIPNLGKLECRPVWPGAQAVQIPLDAWSGRIGYIAVQLDGALREATLLGFVETVTETRVTETEGLSIKELPISRLESLEGLLKYLSQRQRIINSCKRLTTDLSDAIALAQREFHWSEGINEGQLPRPACGEEERIQYQINNIIDPALQKALGVKLDSIGCKMHFEELTVQVNVWDEYLWTISVYEAEEFPATESKYLRYWTAIKPWDVQKLLLITLDDIRTGDIFD